jgi:ankyrin repeat protein
MMMNPSDSSPTEIDQIISQNSLENDLSNNNNNNNNTNNTNNNFFKTFQDSYTNTTPIKKHDNYTTHSTNTTPIKKNDSITTQSITTNTTPMKSNDIKFNYTEHKSIFQKGVNTSTEETSKTSIIEIGNEDELNIIKKNRTHELDIQLHNAIYSQNLKLVQELLIALPKLICSVDEIGRTALHIAARENSVKITELLCRYITNIDAQDISGRTALHMCR